jgi:hypothetical protein
MTPPRAAPRGPRRAAAPARRRETLPVTTIATVLLALHFALCCWVASRNSVTFDENFHLPAGVVALTRGDFTTSYAQPPLSRELSAIAALAAGAREPDPASERIGDERAMGESFMRRNADRYLRVFVAGRLVTALFSLALGLMLWQVARRWYGERAGLVALAAWTLAPEALAHASLVGVDVPTALATFGVAISGFAWLRTGQWKRWAICALWIAAAFLVRFSAVQLFPVLLVLAVLLAWRRRLASSPRTLLGFVLLGLVAIVAVNAGYRFEHTGAMLGGPAYLSDRFQHLAKQWPALRLPLPAGYVRGLDYLAYLSQPGLKSSYFLGKVVDGHDWRYFPVAIAVKWPLGLLGLLLLGIVYRVRVRRVRLDREFALLVPAAAVILTAMSANLDFGVRYVLPALPLLCVWASAPLAEATRARGVRAWANVALVLVAVETVECVTALPYPLSFFNLAAGGRGDRIVNDSNADWGQGLLALKDAMRERGIGKIQLIYHGTTDPGIYGIDYVPYISGKLDPTTSWLAVSSYFRVGLPARLMLRQGYSDLRVYDLKAFDTRVPDARPGGCMYLYRMR